MMEMYNPTKSEQFKDYYRNKFIMGISDDDYCINMQTFFDNFLFFLEKANHVAPILKSIEHDPKLVDLKNFSNSTNYRAEFDSSKRIYNYPDLLNNYIVHYKSWLYNIIAYIHHLWDYLEYYIDFHFKMMKYKNRSLTTVFDRDIGERVELNVQDYLSQAKQSMEQFIAFDIFESTKEIPLGDLKSVDSLIELLNHFHNYFRDMSRFHSIKAMAARRTKTDAIQAICIHLTNITPFSYDINIDQLKNVKYHMTTNNFSLEQLENRYFFLKKKNPKKQGITLYRYTRDFDWNA